MTNLNYLDERQDLAAAFRWTARLNMHEGEIEYITRRL